MVGKDLGDGEDQEVKEKMQTQCLSVMVYMKDFFYSKDIEFLVRKYIPNLAHQNDGIIFTKNQWKYSKGKTTSILKAKPSSLNTIDFNIKLQFKPKWSELSVFGLYADQASNQKYSGKQISRANGRINQKFGILVSRNKQEQNNIMAMLFKKKQIIVECQYVDQNISQQQMKLLKQLRLIELKEQFSLKSSSLQECQQIILKYDALLSKQQDYQRVLGDSKLVMNKCWRVMRFREDKSKANFITVAQNVFECIKEDLKIQELISEFANVEQEEEEEGGEGQFTSGSRFLDV